MADQRRIIIRLSESGIKGYPHVWGFNVGGSGRIEIDNVVEIHGTVKALRHLAAVANDLADNVESIELFDFKGDS